MFYIFIQRALWENQFDEIWLVENSKAVQFPFKHDNSELYDTNW